jgi:hypothetical protein
MTADRDLFLHEYIDINGMHQWDYMEHTRQQSGDEKVDFELLGTWYTMGITARWPQVVNVWEIPDGWDGWFGKIDRLGLKRASNVPLNAWWKQAFEYRSGGFDRLLGGVPGCPNIATLERNGVRGDLFVHEVTEVKPGSALEYLAAVREERAPLLAEYGHHLVGLYEVLMNDYEVCTIWATTAEAHVRAAKARDVARGLARHSDQDADPRFEAWHALARTWCVHWREELMTPHVGTLCAPEVAPLDESVDPGAGP